MQIYSIRTEGSNFAAKKIDMIKKRSNAEWFRRVISFIFSLFVLGIGVALTIRANLGSSPITCPPYVLSMMPSSPLTVGGWIFCMQFFFVLLQWVLLRKDFLKIQILQLGICLLFGFFSDLGMWITEPLQWGDTGLGYVARWLQLAIAGAILGIGVIWEVRSDILLIPGEGLPITISRVFHIDFGKVKIAFDVFLVAVAVICCYIAFGRWRWDLVGASTLFSMFYVGMVVRAVSPHMNWLNRWLTGVKPTETPSVATGNKPLVITISRQYGSGGHQIGEILAKELDIPLYDKSIIDKAAEDLGYSQTKVMAQEQTTTPMQLLEMVFADGGGVLPDMELSEDDAIFVTESRIIRDLAAKGSCVIIGRCADFVLRDRPNCFRVFVRADMQQARNRVVEEYSIPIENAETEIEKVDKERATHYWRYTGKKWSDAENYDLVLNSSKTGINKAVKMIKDAALQ